MRIAVSYTHLDVYKRQENIKPRDLHETYLVPFEALVKEAKVKEVMCAYNRLEGSHSFFSQIT